MPASHRFSLPVRRAIPSPPRTNHPRNKSIKKERAAPVFSADAARYISRLLKPIVGARIGQKSDFDLRRWEGTEGWSDKGPVVHEHGHDHSSIGDLAEISGKSFALVAQAGNGGGAIFSGTARWDGRHLRWERSDVARPIEIPEEQLSAVRRVTADVRHIIGEAEYFVVLPIEHLPEGALPDIRKDTKRPAHEA